jgi:hypothetical protein
MTRYEARPGWAWRGSAGLGMAGLGRAWNKEGLLIDSGDVK